MTFLSFLLEIMVDIDPKDQAQARVDVRKAVQQGGARTAKKQMMKAKAASKEARAARDPDAAREANLKMQLAKIQQRRAMKRKQQGN